MFGFMYNNSFMNFCVPRWNYSPMQFWMPYNYAHPMQNPYSYNLMNYYSLLSIFQNYNSAVNFYYDKPTNKTSRITVEESTIDLTPNNDELVFGVKYNKEKGKLLAENIVSLLPKYRDPENPLCARHVKEAVVNSGLGPYIPGNGEYCKNIFRANKNFKEVNVKGKDFDNLPEGSIIVYNAYEKVKFKDGTENRVGEDGHVLVKLKNNKGCSDKIEEEIAQTDNAYVFIPV